MAKILVVDDEPGIVRFVRRALEAEGHVVVAAHDGPQGLALAAEHRPEMVILDLVMPRVSGMGVLAALSTESLRSRVLVLSAVGDVQARVRCLEMGAVDFLAKPFAVSELVARVRARLQEGGGGTAAEELVSGSLRLDLRSRRLSRGDRSIELSAREYALMRYLMLHSGTVCSRAELLSEVWGYAFDPGSNVVDVTVARLRGKIQGMEIETVRNVGYALQPA
jgi:DNA-binding response OmpR family regulator